MVVQTVFGVGAELRHEARRSHWCRSALGPTGLTSLTGKRTGLGQASTLLRERLAFCRDVPPTYEESLERTHAARARLACLPNTHLYFRSVFNNVPCCHKQDCQKQRSIILE